MFALTPCRTLGLSTQGETIEKRLDQSHLPNHRVIIFMDHIRAVRCLQSMAEVQLGSGGGKVIIKYFRKVMDAVCINMD